MTKRRQYSTDYKTKVALAAIRGDVTIAELAQKYGVHANMMTKWKGEALDGTKETFAGEGKKDRSAEHEIEMLQVKVGELVVERDFLARAFDR